MQETGVVELDVFFKGQKIVLPDFLIIGAAKAGTSSLNYWLEDYDDIFMPTPKEPNFFSFENYQKDYTKNLELNTAVNLCNYNFEAYQSLFRGNENKIIGDASTGYIKYADNVISNIQKYYGDSMDKLKIVCLLRDPVSKVYSHYLMFVKWGVEKRSFQEAVIPRYKRVNTVIELQIDYLSSGYYYEDLKKYKDFFGTNLKIYLFDDLVNDKNSFVLDVLDHIGVKENQLPENINMIFNEGGIPKNNLADNLIKIRNNNWVKSFLKVILPYGLQGYLKKIIDRKIDLNLMVKPKIDDVSKSYLENIYYDDIEKTSSLIERDLTFWLKR